MDLDYFYEEQSEQFVFIRVPMMLMTDERFNGISSDAKILYGLLLDRTVLSARNHWVDKLGRIYIIYTLAGIQKSLHCADKKATKLLCELESIGLIERRKQGQGRPALIYVKNFIPASNVRVKTRQNYDSRVVESTSLDSSKVRCNHIDINHTEYNQTDPIISGEGCDNETRELYRVYFDDQLAVEGLKEKYPHQREMIEGIEDIIIDTVCSGKAKIRLLGEDMSTEVVKSRLMKLDPSHIEYVLESMSRTTTRIRNIRQYLLAALYNAPATIDSYYQQEVQSDMEQHSSNNRINS